MPQIYKSDNPLDLLRFRNFLAQHGIAAEICDSPTAPLNLPNNGGQTEQQSSLEQAVCAPDDQQAQARELLVDFLSIMHNTSDEDSPVFLPNGSTPAPVPLRARVPWLTLLPPRAA
jgi:hypothetical protein